MSEPVLLTSGGLSVVLSRVADRFRHEVLITTAETRVMLTSLEGTDDQAWPPSPPFQELHTRQSSAGVDAVMLVGRAGRSHWSASIELDRSQEAVLFDVACRSSGPIHWLGSSYQWLGNALAVSEEGQTVLGSSDFQLDVLEGQAKVSDQGETHVLSIVPVWTVSSASQTIRWRYRIRRPGARPAG